MTASTLSGIKSMSLFQAASSNSAHTSFKTAAKSSTFLIFLLRFCTLSFICFHKFTMGFRSGDCAGHTIFSTLLFILHPLEHYSGEPVLHLPSKEDHHRPSKSD